MNQSLSLERSQKFDLLVHLLANLDQCLILCGPQGIGKTTFLQRLQKTPLEGWLICLTPCDSHLDIRQVEHKLIQAICAHHQTLPELANNSLDENLSFLASQNQALILILDDADSLKPGLLTQICQLILPFDNLRVVFALRPDGLHIKTATDAAIERCHVIDIPPLNEQQCGDYIDDLLRKTAQSPAPEEIVTPELIAKTYEQTHGIPGLIASLIQQGTPQSKPKKPRISPQTLHGLILICGLITVAIAIWTWNPIPKMTAPTPSQQQSIPLAIQPEKHPVHSPQENSPALSEEQALLPMQTTNPAPLTPEQDTNDIIAPSETNKASETPASEQPPLADHNDVQTPQIDTPENPIPPSDSESDQPNTPPDRSAPEQTTDTPSLAANSTPPPLPVSPPATEQTAPAPEPSQPTDNRQTDETLHDAEWILTQDPNAYSLQLIAVSKRQSISLYIKKHPGLQNLAYFNTARANQKRYILLSGVFPSLKSAREAIKLLPASVGKPWPRKLKSIQNDIANYRKSNLP